MTRDNEHTQANPDFPTDLDALKLAYVEACEERDHLRSLLLAAPVAQEPVAEVQLHPHDASKTMLAELVEFEVCDVGRKLYAQPPSAQAEPVSEADELPYLLRDGPYFRDGKRTREIMAQAADEIERLRGVQPSGNVAIDAAQTLGEAIYKAAQKMGIANSDHTSLSVSQLLHLLECMSGQPSGNAGELPEDDPRLTAVSDYAQARVMQHKGRAIQNDVSEKWRQLVTAIADQAQPPVIQPLTDAAIDALAKQYDCHNAPGFKGFAQAVATLAQQASIAESVSQTLPERDVDAIISALYRRFKDWSKRGFGPDDVTWCEVKADVLALLAQQAVTGNPTSLENQEDAQRWRYIRNIKDGDIFEKAVDAARAAAKGEA